MIKLTAESQRFFNDTRDFFTIYLPKQKGASANTIKLYKKTMNQFVDFTAKEIGIDYFSFTYDNCSRDSLEKYLQHIEENGCAIGTRNLKLTAVRRFFKYAAERDISLVPIYQGMLLIPTKKAADKEIEFFSENALKEILSVPDSQTRRGYRDLVIMMFLYDSGARVQELLDLKIQDLHLDSDNHFVNLLGKGKKWRTIPIMKKTKEHLLRYIKMFHPNPCSTDHVFFTERNGVKTKMSADNIAKLISKYADIARRNCSEVPEHIYPHMFRHSRAMHMYRNGIDLTVVSEFLGHSQVETTIKYYANANMEMKEQAIEKATAFLGTIAEDNNDFVYSDSVEALKELYGLI